MTHQKWFISDTHFFHANMLKFVDDQGHRIRPFNLLDEQHEIMVESLRDGDFNVHGHTHSKNMEDPHYINVSVEVREYTPVHMDTILAEIKKVS